MKLSCPGDAFWGDFFFITNSIFLIFIGLFNFLYWVGYDSCVFEKLDYCI